MRFTILLLILSIVVAYPKYKEARGYYHTIKAPQEDARECGTMTGMMLNAAHEKYGILAQMTTDNMHPLSIYVDETNLKWKIMSHDSFTGYTCTILKGNSWFYSSTLGVL